MDALVRIAELPKYQRFTIIKQAIRAAPPCASIEKAYDLVCKLFSATERFVAVERMNVIPLHYMRKTTYQGQKIFFQYQSGSMFIIAENGAIELRKALEGAPSVLDNRQMLDVIRTEYTIITLEKSGLDGKKVWDPPWD